MLVSLAALCVRSMHGYLKTMTQGAGCAVSTQAGSAATNCNTVTTVGGAKHCKAESDSDHEGIRADLVAAHRLTALHGYDELTWNHISCRVGPQHDDASVFLITPGDKM